MLKISLDECPQTTNSKKLKAQLFLETLAIYFIFLPFRNTMVSLTSLSPYPSKNPKNVIVFLCVAWIPSQDGFGRRTELAGHFSVPRQLL